MSIRNLERMLDWGDKIGCISLIAFLGSFVLSIAFALASLIENQPDLMAAASVFLKMIGIMGLSVVLSIAAMAYANCKLKKFNPQHSYGVNWKRDGF